MLHCDLSQQEQHRRKEIAEHTRQMLLTELPIDSQDETSTSCFSLVMPVRGWNQWV